jgi:hypothetical protein
MLVCPNPKCKKRNLKKYYDDRGFVYYMCGACGYSTIPFCPSDPSDTVIERRVKYMK